MAVTFKKWWTSASIKDDVDGLNKAIARAAWYAAIDNAPSSAPSETLTLNAAVKGPVYPDECSAGQNLGQSRDTKTLRRKAIRIAGTLMGPCFNEKHIDTIVAILMAKHD